MSGVASFLADLDGYHFAAGVLFVAAFFIYAASLVAGLGQSRPVVRTSPASSNRKAGRVR